MQSLAERIHTVENDNLNLIGKIQSMLMGYKTLQKGTERLSQIIYIDETDNKNPLKCYGKNVSPGRQSSRHPNNIQG